MIDRRLGPIKILRGTQVEIDPIIIDEGYLIYSTDKNRVYVGDGITRGSVSISTKNYLSVDEGIPKEALYGDIIYKPDPKLTYIVGYDTDNKTLKLILISDGNYYDILQKQIDDLYTKYRQLSACIEDSSRVDNICKCD